MALYARIRSSKEVAAILCAVMLASVIALASAIALAFAPTLAYAASYDGYSTSTIEWGLGVNYNHKSPDGSVSAKRLAKFDAYYVGNTSKKKKRIYLSFDCGYENGYTAGILDTLKKNKVKAVFFVTSEFINEAPKLVKRMKREGHLVGNHTVNHPHMSQMSPSGIKKELLNNEKLMKRKTGYTMDKIWRPPYGEASERTMKVAQSMGYITIFWSMAYYDYDPDEQPGSGYVIDYFKNHHHPGAITLTHSVSSSNRWALNTVIKNLKKRGYSFALLSDLKLTKPGKATLKNVASKKPGVLEANFKKLKGVDGYQMQIATNAKFTKGVKTVKISKSAKKYKQFKNLKQGKKYYVRVRGYKKGSVEKLYGKWSKKKSVVIMRKPTPKTKEKVTTATAAETASASDAGGSSGSSSGLAAATGVTSGTATQ